MAFTLHSDELREHVVYPGTPRRNLRFAELLESAIQNKEGVLASNGAFAAVTAPRTGRSPKDKFIVKSVTTEKIVDWGNNQAMSPEAFDKLFNKFANYVQERECFVFNGFAGADPDSRLNVRIITEYAWHNMFVRQLFIRPTAEELKSHRPDFRVICMPNLKFDAERDGINSDAVIAVNFDRRVVLIGGTRYAGEMKKSIFSVMNFVLPQHDILSMHCSANMGKSGDVALFFGLSGTGKTTLSADPNRQLIGDDEHGWGNNGVFNIEGGCYAKCIDLAVENEPEIFNAIQFGAVLENVILNDDRTPDYTDSSITENTRAAYPLNHIKNAVIPSIAGHPSKVIFLTADATGVLPPVARLDENQAMYHFLSGYTSKLAGTETGITEPTLVFSACFGSPFLPLHPTVYAELLGKKLKEYNAKCYLINTGWNGGPYGVGNRIKLKYTRAIIDAVLNGELDNAETVTDKFFGLHIPTFITNVPSEILQPRETWSNKEEYDSSATALAQSFRENFEKFEQVSDAIKSAEPKG